jgi:hypothetical protein
MATADVINMNDFPMDVLSHEQPDDKVEHGLRPKGHAIAGVDYGIDLLEEKPQEQPPAQMPQQMQPQMQPQMQQQMQPQMQPQMMQQMPPQDHGVPESRSVYSGGMGGMGLPGFPVSNDIQSLGSSSHVAPGAGFVDSNLLGQMPMPTHDPGMIHMQEMSYEEKRSRKTDALASLSRLESQGYVPAGKKGSHTTELFELEAMVEKLTTLRDLDNSIKYQRKILMGFANLVESVCENDDYNIFEMDLEGWSESLYENISDYDEIFEELYLKYKDVAHIPPEIKLITMVAGSAWMFHMSRNMFGKAASKVPGFDEVMKYDPDLKKRYQQTATSLAQQRGMPVPNRKKDKGNLNFLGQMFGTNQTHDMAPPPAAQPRRAQRPRGREHGGVSGAGRRPSAPAAPPRRTRNRVPMEEPHDVDGLLSGLVTQGGMPPGPHEEDEIDLSEMENMSDLDARM